jgi:phenylacetate-CoA ligase
MRDWYEGIFHRLLHPAYESPLRGRYTLQYLADYQANQRLSSDEVQALQWRKLQALVRHCWGEVPFYRAHWGTVIDDPADLHSLHDFARLPTLTKAHVRTQFDRLHARSGREGLLYKHTDGTTGEPLRFAYSRIDYERRQALMHRGYAWAGYRIGSRCVYLWWSPQLAGWSLSALRQRLHHRLFNRSMLDAMQLDRERMPEYARRIAMIRPKAIVGYVTPLYLLARWARETGTPLHRPEVILTAAEPLEENQRAEIAGAFGAPVRNTYGCREFMLIAAEHAACGNMHINSDQLLVESAPLDLPAAPRTEQLIFTDLANRSMPLVRYLNGDVGVLGQRPCACGLPFPLLDRVDGRRFDVVRTPSGKSIHCSALTWVFLEVSGIVQYRIMQCAGGSLEVLLVPGAEYTEAIGRQIVAQMQQVAAEPMAITIRLVDHIAAGHNGKSRPIGADPAPEPGAIQV